MIHVHSLSELHLKDSWLAIGVFDGVHRGHQKIISKLTEGAHAKRVPAVVLTFWPHPAFVLGGGEVKVLLRPMNVRIYSPRSAWMLSLLIHLISVVADLSAREFMERLKEHLGISHLLMGYDFALGKAAKAMRLVWQNWDGKWITPPK